MLSTGPLSAVELGVNVAVEQVAFLIVDTIQPHAPIDQPKPNVNFVFIIVITHRRRVRTVENHATDRMVIPNPHIIGNIAVNQEIEICYQITELCRLFFLTSFPFESCIR